MANLMQAYGGVITPYIKIAFGDWGIISVDSSPRYFVNISHNRTCDMACSARITLKYVPETFKRGQPNDLDILILSNLNQPITYMYGYYDSYGRLHIHEALYVGVYYTYKSDFDIESGCVTYEIEVLGKQVEFLNKIGKIEMHRQPVQPSMVVQTAIEFASNYSTGFDVIRDNFDWRNNISHEDVMVEIPTKYINMPIIDIILGTKRSIDKNNGQIVRTGGLVEYARTPTGFETLTDPDSINKYNRAKNYMRSSGSTIKSEQGKYIQWVDNLATSVPFISYFDNIKTSSGKWGSFYFRPKTAEAKGANEVYVINMDDENNFKWGNHINDSRVRSFTVDWDGGKASASYRASEKVVSGIDLDGGNTGASNMISKILGFSDNVYNSISKFKSDGVLSISRLADILNYPTSATLQVLGELYPHHLLDYIYIVVYLNGTEHSILSGEYQIIEITDELSENGFFTTFKLTRREISDKHSETETFIANSESGNSAKVDKNVKQANNFYYK